jgi:hypothetical protein
MLDRKRRFTGKQKRPLPLFSMCLLEDANSVQIALMQVLSLLGSGQIEHKEAGLMLYGLQTASMNLKHTTFEAAEVTDVVIDRDTVNATRIGGQQWFEEDFETVEEDVIEQEDSAEQEDNEEQNNAEQNNIEQGSEEQHDEAGDEAADEDAAVSEPVMAATALHASIEARVRRGRRSVRRRRGGRCRDSSEAGCWKRPPRRRACTRDREVGPGTRYWLLGTI